MGDDWSKNVIWSVEKWFTLRPHHNRKNDVTWGKVNPHEVVESKEQGVSKVMAWVGFVNGKFLPIHWFEGNVDGDQYKSMLESKVWPAVRRSASRNRLWFMQDGARPHTTNECLDFLKEKFNNRVISDKLDLFWLPKSPDLDPLDYSVWGNAEKAVFQAKPETVEELKKVVEDYLESVSKEELLRITANFNKRAALCLKVNGGHFEQLLKKKN